MEIRISDHAQFEARRRQIDLEVLMGVLNHPEQKVKSSEGRAIHQSRYYDTIERREMLLRVVVILEADGLKVVTVYKTSKIDKYWVREA